MEELEYTVHYVRWTLRDWGELTFLAFASGSLLAYALGYLHPAELIALVFLLLGWEDPQAFLELAVTSTILVIVCSVGCWRWL